MNQPRHPNGRWLPRPQAEADVSLTLPGPQVNLVSDSHATDGGYLAIADMADILAGTSYRLIGGTAVMLHVQRLGLDLPVRRTGDADFGVTLGALRDESVTEALTAIGYTKIEGNRWERGHDEVRTATVDLLIPGYTSKLRSNHKVGSTTTTEVPGLAEAFRRAPVEVLARLILSDGSSSDVKVTVPDPVSMLGLKIGARQVRDETRDAEDLWRCLEVLHASGHSGEFKAVPEADIWFAQLSDEVGDGGRSLPSVTAGCSHAEAERRRTRLRALLAGLAPA